MAVRIDETRHVGESCLGMRQPSSAQRLARRIDENGQLETERVVTGLRSHVPVTYGFIARDRDTPGRMGDLALNTAGS